MLKSYRKRVRNIGKYLQPYLVKDEEFYIGLLFEDYLKSPLLEKYKLPLKFPNASKVIPKPKGSVTKANINGKFERKKPEEKEEIIKHIHYVRQSNGSIVDYDRKFNIYKKILLHQYKAYFIFIINSDGQKIVISEKLKNTQTKKDNMKIKHVANMFNEIFNDFEIFTKDLRPALHFNKKFEQLILPSGTLSDRNNFQELVEIGKRFNKNEKEQTSFFKRLKLIRKYNPDIRGKGPNGFEGYIVFGFTHLGIVLLEKIKKGNATYVFSNENFEKKIIQDKQTILETKKHIKRFYHSDKWENKVNTFLEKRLKLATKEYPQITKAIDAILAMPHLNSCYIGASENLNQRWEKYSEWTFKGTLYETDSLDDVKYMEALLIAYVMSKDVACNLVSDSRGLKEGAKKYYIYILADEMCKKRD